MNFAFLKQALISNTPFSELRHTFGVRGARGGSAAFVSGLALPIGFCSTVLVKLGHPDFENSKLIWNFSCFFFFLFFRHFYIELK